MEFLRQKMTKKNKINPILKKITIARLNTLSDKIRINIGQTQSFTKNDLVKQINQETEIGCKMVDIQMQFLQDLVGGKIYNDA